MPLEATAGNSRKKKCIKATGRKYPIEQCIWIHIHTHTYDSMTLRVCMHANNCLQWWSGADTGQRHFLAFHQETHACMHLTLHFFSEWFFFCKFLQNLQWQSVHPPKPMMHVVCSPISTKFISVSPYLRNIFYSTLISFKLRFFRSIYAFCSPYFDQWWFYAPCLDRVVWGRGSIKYYDIL